MTPSSETRVDSISLRIVVLFLAWLISCSRARLRAGQADRRIASAASFERLTAMAKVCAVRGTDRR
jgi:hypothetical protein